MALTDKQVANNAAFAKEVLLIPITTAVSQTDKEVFSFVPGFRGQIESVQAFSLTKAGAVTLKVRVGGANFGAGRDAITALTAPATGAAAAGANSATLANRRFSSTEAVRVGYTSDGTGALTGAFVLITYRPTGLAGDGM